MKTEQSVIASYDGYTASIYWDEEVRCFVGDVLGLIHTSFDICGATVKEAIADFRKWIDLYLKDCKEEGSEPERPDEALGEKTIP